MSEIHYFPRYSQKENFVTNNTLLLLLRLHQYSRLKFENFIQKLCADAPDIQLSTSWLHFQQQKSTNVSVLDGFISQDSVRIAVETKLADSFDLEQLENHLNVFGDERHKLLIMLSPKTDYTLAATTEPIRKLASRRNVQILHTSFEMVVRAARNCLSEHDEYMLALVDDYESFCSESDLLPEDQYLIFVPPCGKSFEDNISFKLYYCWATWTRRRTRYLGVYFDKAVRAIGRISKIVHCEVDVDTGRTAISSIEGAPGLTAEEEQRIVAACKNGPQRGWALSAGHKFYLCDELAETEFRKKSAGGMQGHRYIDLREHLSTDVPDKLADLASILRQREWS